MKLSVCIPTYKGTPYLKETLDSVFSQDFGDFEVIICNDSQEDADQLQALLRPYGDKIRLFQNETNLGYPENLRKTVSKARGDILFLLGQDDILLGTRVFSDYVSIFETHETVGCITRPYYWFVDDVNSPIRRIGVSPVQEITVDSSDEVLRALYGSLGQLSALAYRRALIEPSDFASKVFTAHIKPFLKIMRTHSAYFFPKYNLAVRTTSSQTRFLSSIYRPSPTKTWIDMFQKVFKEDKYKHAREIGIDHISLNYVGLVQIKNYGYFRDLLSDIYYLIYYRPRNLLSPAFWAIVLGTVFLPRRLLRKLTDLYKRYVNSKFAKVAQDQLSTS